MSTKYSSSGRPYLAIDISAGDIPYDPSTSGLAATDVQGAIDELSAVTIGGLFSGHVSAAGTLSGGGSGWSAALGGTSEYTVTHNLGHQNYDVSVTAWHDGVASVDDSFQAVLISKNNDDFVYRTYRSEDTTTTQDATAADFMLKVR